MAIGILGAIGSALAGAAASAAKKNSGSSSGQKVTASRGESSKSSGTAVSSKDKTGSATGSGYQSGGAYGNRETAYTWKDGTTTYSGDTNWRDAAKREGKEGIGLKSAVTYSIGNNRSGGKLTGGGSGGRTSFSDRWYSSATPNKYDYQNALRYEQDIQDLYKNGYTGEYYGYGSIVDPNSPQAQAAALQANYYQVQENPYDALLAGVDERYAALERQQLEQIAAATEQSVDRLNAQRKGIDDTYEEMARQAYIDYAQQNFALPGQLAQLGVNGGASESAQLGLNTAYSGNLNNILTAKGNAMTELDNAIIDVRNSGDLQKADAILANSQAALAAYQNLMQNKIAYDYQAGRDAIGDQRYNQEWAYQMGQQALENQRYNDQWAYQLQRDAIDDARYEQSVQNSLSEQQRNNVLTLLEMGFAPENAAQILGVPQSAVDGYVSYLTTMRDLDLTAQQLAYQKSLSSGRSSGSSSGGSRGGNSGGNPEGATVSADNVNLIQQYYNQLAVGRGSEEAFHNIITQLLRIGKISEEDYDAWRDMSLWG